MRINRMALLVATYTFSALVAPTYSNAAGFDCAKASTPIEKTICSDQHLSSQDDALSSAYKKSLAQSGTPDQVKADQREWIKTKRNPCGPDVSCLTTAYKERISILGGATATTQEPIKSATQPEILVPAQAAPLQENSSASQPALAEAQSPAPTTTEVVKSDSTAISAIDEAASSSSESHGIVRLLVTLLFLTVCIAAAVGLFKPQMVIRWKQNPDRTMVVKYSVPALLILGISMSLLMSPAEKAQIEAKREMAVKEADAEKARRKEVEQAAAESERVAPNTTSPVHVEQCEEPITIRTACANLAQEYDQASSFDENAPNAQMLKAMSENQSRGIKSLAQSRGCCWANF